MVEDLLYCVFALPPKSRAFMVSIDDGSMNLEIDNSNIILHKEILSDTVSERLRRWTRNPLGSARRGSNPLGVDIAQSSVTNNNG